MPRSHESYSDAARAGWESRWDSMIERGEIDKLGPKGMDYYIANYLEDEEWEDYEDFEIDQYEEDDTPEAK